MHNAIIIDFEIIQIVRIEIFLFVVVSACSFHISSINRDSLGWIFCQIYFISQDGFQLINHSRWLHRCIRHNDIFITLFGILQIDNCRHLRSFAAVRQSQCCVISNEKWELNNEHQWKELSANCHSPIIDVMKRIFLYSCEWSLLLWWFKNDFTQVLHFKECSHPSLLRHKIITQIIS